MMGHCAAAEHNQEHPDDLQAVVVGPDPQGTDDKIFFKTIPVGQADQVHAVCLRAGQAAFAFMNAADNIAPPIKVVVGAVGAATDNGAVDCDGYLHALQKDNPFVILVPGIISGSAVTVKILDMIGAKRPAAEVQAAVDNVGHQAGNVLAKGADEIKKHPLILLAAPAAPLVALAAATHVPLPTVHVSCKLQVRCSFHGLHSSCKNMCS
jgi:hypothetical protein